VFSGSPYPATTMWLTLARTLWEGIASNVLFGVRSSTEDTGIRESALARPKADTDRYSNTADRRATRVPEPC
jgi:hypothetical protein